MHVFWKYKILAPLCCCIAAIIFCGAIRAEEIEWPDFDSGQILGVPNHPGLIEISGIAASRKNPGVLWVHNDSGGGPTVYAMTEKGKLLAVVQLPAAEARDWEDMAIGPGESDGQWYIYIADSGNNARRKKQLEVIRFEEPDISLEQNVAAITIPSITRHVFVYPNAAEKVYDCETFLVDPLTSDFYFVTKGSGSDEGRSYVFRAAPPFQRFRTNTLEEVERFRIGKEIKDLVTAGDISPDGQWIIVRSYTRGRIYKRPEGGTIADAFAGGHGKIPIKNEPQGEAIGFAPDGKGYYTTSEENRKAVIPVFGPQPIYYYPLDPKE